jgi:hypothetical protein
MSKHVIGRGETYVNQEESSGNVGNAKNYPIIVMPFMHNRDSLPCLCSLNIENGASYENRKSFTF